ncbi:O-antigen ligase family protein [Crateriforma conspicua]|uniref:O-Antigen ligase n=1 Tax=Crateriforma conspicua TaxID=2527996 RepID=A0A5C5XXM8_9PLAN|nr:O-antigen ligase family protein [Crateriforma conspicua]QDV63037.1 O-Antigen ligase [Crateriforma conspicua]TWT68176.1 O-Antigen ligase [Crateriforma conspicua]
MRLIHWFYLALVFLTLVQIPVYENDVTGNTLNAYHLLLPIGLILGATRIHRLTLNLEMCFFISMACTTMFTYWVYGYNIRGILLVFAGAACVAGADWVHRTTVDERKQTLRIIFWMTIIAIIARNVMYHGELATIYSREKSNSPVWFLASGGPNLESTHLGMLAALLVGTSLFLPSLAIAAITSVLMLSRAGVIACLAASCFWIAENRRNPYRIGFLLIALIGATTYVMLLAGGRHEDQLTQRFDIKAEQRLADQRQGRLAIWKSASQQITSNPLGHGAGNGFAMMNRDLDHFYRENNSHNIFIDLTMDGGVQSTLLLLMIVFANLRQPLTRMDSCTRLVWIYFLLGMFEFTGYDIIGWFFIGASSASRALAKQAIDEQQDALPPADTNIGSIDDMMSLPSPGEVTDDGPQIDEGKPQPSARDKITADDEQWWAIDMDRIRHSA